MTDHILEAYSTDIDFRIHGFEKQMKMVIRWM